jgi:hypothetical protein
VRSYANVHWFGQMVGLYLFTAGIVVVFVRCAEATSSLRLAKAAYSFVPYIIESYRTYAASAMAVRSVALRSALHILILLVRPPPWSAPSPQPRFRSSFGRWRPRCPSPAPLD